MDMMHTINVIRVMHVTHVMHTIHVQSSIAQSHLTTSQPIRFHQ